MKALITGASAGIGREMAKILAARGYELILVSRREERLRALADTLAVPCHILAVDVSDPQECRLLHEAVQKTGGIDLLVNNAGFGLCGRFAELPLEDELRMIQTNIVAVHILTKLFLQDFRVKNSGCILNVASSAGFMAGPLMATYYATKNYVLRLTQAIHEELRREGSAVKIAALCPGPVNTEFNQVAGVRFAIPGLDSHAVAQCALDGALAGKGVIVPGLGMKLSLFARRFVPEGVVTRIAYHIQSQKLKP